MRFTFDPADDFVGLWSADGHEIVCNSRRRGHLELFRRRADASGDDEAVLVDTIPDAGRRQARRWCAPSGYIEPMSENRGSAASDSASGRPSSLRTMLVPWTRATIL